MWGFNGADVGNRHLLLGRIFPVLAVLPLAISGALGKAKTEQLAY
jgi:hypothetical protein